MCNCGNISNCGCASTILPIGPAGQDGTTITLGVFGSTPNANGLTLTLTGNNGVLNMQPASDLFSGGVSTTTQIFAGAKTFNVLTGNLSIDANGLGIGALATSHIFSNLSKTYTTALGASGTDLGSQIATIFDYSSANNDVSTSAAKLVVPIASGAFAPIVMAGVISLPTNSMDALVTLGTTIGYRATHISSVTRDTTTTVNVGFTDCSFSNKANPAHLTNITSNYAFYSANPFLNNNGAFNITTQYGFYCDNYRVDTTPIISKIGSGTKTVANITDAWQIYMKGTNSTDIGSYIGNRLGIGFSSNPTANSQVTALLHIGAGTTTSAQVRLTVGVAPTTPNDGDIWLESNTNTGLKIRINGVTKTITLS